MRIVAMEETGRGKRGHKDPRSQWFSRPLSPAGAAPSRGSPVLYTSELATAAVRVQCHRESPLRSHSSVLKGSRTRRIKLCLLALIARMKLVGSSKRRGGLGRALKEHKARLYIIRRCVVMLLRWDD
ncbi:hypothetical protein BAE44_0000236 [Dichanthelium oligosanthes]|uniref:ROTUNDIFOLIA like 8 n=3 Tax=Paniceae TaxID=147428 RepID=A0A1E5WN05_9POAL|nr:hypothetical protein BAE44_0000236 [Dichanthelium oligosanthes]